MSSIINNNYRYLSKIFLYILISFIFIFIGLSKLTKPKYGYYYSNNNFLHNFENKGIGLIKKINEYNRLFQINGLCEKILIGDIHKDGYKIGCLNFYKDNKCIVYSLGSNGDFRYEHEIYNNFGCEIFTIDKDIFNAPSYVNFKKAMIGTCSECKTINEILFENKHENIKINAFKIDIEGSEWTILDQVFNNNFKQIQIEIHNPNYEKMRDLEKYVKNWVLIDINPNVSNGNVLELVFVNKEYLKNKN
jgi:hypothetical protein